MIYLYRYRIPPEEKVESIPYLQRAVLAYLAEFRRDLRLMFKPDTDRKPDDFNMGMEAEKKHTIAEVQNEGKQDLLLSVQIEKTERGKPQVKLFMGDKPAKLLRSLEPAKLARASAPIRLRERPAFVGIDLPELMRAGSASESIERSGLSEPFDLEDLSGRFSVSDLHISATHTKNLVICAVGRENLGIDGEFPEERRTGIFYEKIAARFFTERELRYVKTAGLDGFFKIWVRKEAYMKYTGEGMAYGLKNIETRGSSGFLKTINGCRIVFEKREGLYFACAGGGTELVWK